MKADIGERAQSLPARRLNHCPREATLAVCCVAPKARSFVHEDGTAKMCNDNVITTLILRECGQFQ